MVDHLAIAKRTPPVAESEGADFAQLYQKHIDAVFNYCLYRVGDVAVAEDLTADVFERAWSARHRYNSGRASYSTWLLTIARRRVIDWQRSQGRRHTVALGERLPSPLPGPDMLAQEAEEQSHLQRLVRSLPRDAQDLLAMKYGAGMTNRQIAEILHKSETAVGSALHRLVRQLRLLWEAL